MFLIGIRGFTSDAVSRGRSVVRIDLAHILIPLILHNTPDFSEGRQREVRLVGTPYLGHTFGDTNQRICHAIDILFAFHSAEFGDVLFHETHLLVDVPEFLLVEFHHVVGVSFRPANQYRVGIFERRTLCRRGDAVLDLHKEHVSHDA